VDSYGEVSPDGVEHFPVVAAKIARAATEDPGLDAAELAGIRTRTLVPGASHGLLSERPELCSRLVTEFLTA
jgi:pimeloyl-ACP methyl ester carboxylesterase